MIWLLDSVVASWPTDQEIQASIPGSAVLGKYGVKQAHPVSSKLFTAGTCFPFN